MRRASPVIAFSIAVLGIFTFSCLDAVMKVLVLSLGTITALFWRNLAGIAVSGAIYAAKKQPLPSRAALKLHVIRGSVSAVMSVAFFWGLARVPLAQTVAMTFIAPLLSLFLSARLLKERITAKTILASVIAFTGVLVILLGQWHAALGHAAFLGTLAILFSAVCYAYNIVLMRQQALMSGPIEVAFWQSVIIALLMGVGAPFFAGLPPLVHAPMILLAATLAVCSLLLLAWAYARGEASYLSTSEYTAFIWASAFGWLLFGEHVSPATVAGTLLIVGGCIVAARRGPGALIDTQAAP
ncbi:MAG: DMT family transporter [Pseudomonadota bacterium]|nr:DMT family transporter [Pseudomonadota bacterium]